MHVCSTHGCHASHAHAGFCADCMAVHAGGLSISVPAVLVVALGIGLLAYAGRRLLRASRATGLAAA
ncbi:MAG: hypothetical protein NCW75_08660 [Phycisphaera sp.]|nr:MAG: hypothetical protein NCW75_08660 [Phycisphaera sp.]